jgi:hypothetical protein
VRGSFFSEYVRMIRRQKNVDWSNVLLVTDLVYLRKHIDEDEWYPMATFERMGVAILKHLDGATLDAVRLWGRFSASAYAERHPDLIEANSPMESLMRLKVLRSTLFDFTAFDLPMLVDGHSYVAITYHMGPVAEEAACHQTMGFCEGVLSLAGARNTRADFVERAWEGDSRTLLDLQWDAPGQSVRPKKKR